MCIICYPDGDEDDPQSSMETDHDCDDDETYDHEAAMLKVQTWVTIDGVEVSTGNMADMPERLWELKQYGYALSNNNNNNSVQCQTSILCN